MKVIDEIKEKGGEMILFESFCGGFSPDQTHNLWIINLLGHRVMWCWQVKEALLSLFKRGLKSTYRIAVVS
jgi:hypothetical protein